MSDINTKLIIVSNRLPVKMRKENGKYIYLPAEGGLATGLGSIFNKETDIWIGWPGIEVNEADKKDTIPQELTDKESLYPVFLSSSEIKNFYEGFSNQVLWPLCHYFPSYANFDPEAWESYVEVNKKFADIVCKTASADDIIWVHDYHLMLVPHMVRMLMGEEVSIGFFQHIPFPSYEIFRLIPWRTELLKGMMGADLIGFQTDDDVRHFTGTVARLLNAHAIMGELHYASRTLSAGAFPISIAYDKFKENMEHKAVGRYEEKIRKQIGKQKLMVSIDRLDYSKGILQRLNAYNLFLKKYPSFLGQVVFFLLIVPSRDSVEKYMELKEEINKIVSSINSSYGTLTWQPIFYFYKSWPLTALLALYSAADIALVTPLRDGMNLVCKEYIACKKLNGVLILSELAGAAKELNEALIINPTDEDAVADTIFRAFTMSEEEKSVRMMALNATVKRFNIYRWKDNFMAQLKKINSEQRRLKSNPVTDSMVSYMEASYREASKRLIFLDYDGTLVSFCANPDMAAPDGELRRLLFKLGSDSSNKVVIISGREKNILSDWLGDLPVDIIAEHGAWRKAQNGEWEAQAGLSNERISDIASLLQEYKLRTPGSFLEIKDYSVAWHYRNTDNDLGEQTAGEIICNLKYNIADYGFQILKGNKVIEVKSVWVNKGLAAKEWIDKNRASFILAMGDDQTDEDIFKVMPLKAVTIKVGQGSSAADYRLEGPKEVRRLLRHLSAGVEHSLT